VTNNYWGMTDLARIRAKIYPDSWLWNVTYSPILTNAATGFTPPGRTSGDDFQLALEQEKSGNFAAATYAYRQIINEYPDSLTAVWAASRLIGCLDDSTHSNIPALKEGFIAMAADTTHVALSHYANRASAMCDRIMGQYQDAVDQYEVLLDREPEMIDSLCLRLDIVHTYLEMSADSDSGRSAVKAVSMRHPECRITSVTDANEQEDALWGLITANTDEGGVWAPEFTTPQLYSNYPNPFNPSTTIRYDLPQDADVRLTVYNIRGQKVATLVKERLERGQHQVVWNGVDEHGRSVSSGVYLYRLDAAGKSTAKKMLLLK
jgi:tetratricopeptide (TPR) repeat protein